MPEEEAKAEELAAAEKSTAEVKPKDDPPPPVPFPDPPPPQNSPPTDAQVEWMAAHPRFVRTSHARIIGRWQEEGTLNPDGTFVPAARGPIMDGNGSFGVGVPY